MNNIEFVSKFINKQCYKEKFVIYNITTNNVANISGRINNECIELPITYDINNYYLLGFVTNGQNKLCFIMSEDKCMHFIDLHINDNMFKNSLFIVGIPKPKTFVIYDVLMINGFNCDSETLLDKFLIIRHIFNNYCCYQVLNIHKLRPFIYDQKYGSWTKDSNTFFLTPLFYNNMVSSISNDWFYDVKGLLWVPMKSINKIRYNWKFKGECVDFCVILHNEQCHLVENSELERLKPFRSFDAKLYKLCIYSTNKPLIFFSYIDTEEKLSTPSIVNCYWSRLCNEWKLNYIRKGFQHQTNYNSLLKLNDDINISFNNIKNVYH